MEWGFLLNSKLVEFIYFNLFLSKTVPMKMKKTGSGRSKIKNLKVLGHFSKVYINRDREFDSFFSSIIYSFKMVSRVASLIVIASALACSVIAKPISSTTTSSAATATATTTNSGYDTKGLPSNIFPDLSSLDLGNLKDTNELNDGQQYLKEQNDGKKLW